MTVDIFIFRSPDDGETQSGESLLLVHQAKWQQDLLHRYGGEICLLDATYKTSIYGLPLFFVCINSNVGYSIVGSFITETESSDAIYEALKVLSDWNPNWCPDYFMTDYDEQEIAAVEKLFPGILYF